MREQKKDFLGYIYYLMFESQMSPDAGEALKEKGENMVYEVAPDYPDELPECSIDVFRNAPDNRPVPVQDLGF